MTTFMTTTSDFNCSKCGAGMATAYQLNIHQCQPKETVNHPDHYTAGGLETIDILKAKLTPEQYEGFLLGNVIKYTTRYGHKNGVEDIRKALWYLNHLLYEKEKAPN